MTYRIGFIGTGATPDDPDEDGFAMAYRHADAYERLEDCELVACADIVRENAEKFADTYGVAGVYEDYKRMLEDAALDIVSVCVPPNVHADIVVGCADFPDLKAIHCEKPMATTLADCQRMCDACEAAGIKLTFNHQKRTGPIFKRAKQLLDEGKIGELQRIEISADNLFDAGTHMIHLAGYYVDWSSPEWVIAGLDYSEENRQFGVHNENQALAQWQYENGVYALATTGRSSDAAGAVVRLSGDEGTIEVGAENGPPLRIRTGRTLGWKTVEVGENIWGNRSFASIGGLIDYVRAAVTERTATLLGKSVDGYPSHIDRAIAEVVAAVREGRESVLTWRRAIESTEVIFAAWESARRRARVEFPLEIEDNPLRSMVENDQLAVAVEG